MSRSLAVTFLTAVLLLGGTEPGQAQLSSPESVRVPRADVKVLATGKGFVRLQFEASLAATNHLAVTDQAVGEAGQVADPAATRPYQWMASTWVGLPAGAQPELHVLEARETDPGSVSALSVSALSVADDPASGGAVLDGPVKLGDVVRLRDQHAAPIVFLPRRQADGRITLYDRVVVDVVFDDSAVAGWPVRDPHFQPFYESVLANEEQARKWRTRSSQPARRIAQAGETPTTGMIRVTVRSEGMYRVTAEDLDEAGVDLKDIDPARIRVLYGGGNALARTTVVSSGVMLQEQPSLVEGGEDGTFRGEDAIIFYGEGPERWEYRRGRGYLWRRNLYTRDNVYWIDLHAPQPAVRPDVVSGALAADADVVVDFYRQRLHEEDERTILRQLYGMNSGYDWYWEPFTGNARNFPVTMNHVVAGAPVNIRVGFWGWTNSTHTFDLTWNEESLGRRGFFGASTNQISATAAAGAIDGLNQLGLFHRSTNLTRLDWYEIEYLRHLDGSEGVLAFDWPASKDGGPPVNASTEAVVQFDLRGFAAREGRPRVFIVSDDLTEVGDLNYDEAAGVLQFQDTFGGTEQPPRYIAVQTPFLRRVSNLEIDRQQSLRAAASGADDIIITHADFASAAQRLADWRAADERFGEPMSTLVVDVQDIYDEFSGGLVDPMAIRAFINHAYDHWQPRPAYITLVGDGTYDYKNNSGTSHTNWMPPYQDGESTYDEWYVRVEGEDRAPDMAIGRLPVTTPEQAEGVVDKIIAYDRGDAAGPWQGRVLLVADDLVNPAEKGAFESYFLIDAERMARNMLPEGLDVEKLYIASFPLEGRIKPRARDEFIRLFNEGSLVLTYIGHGNPETLAHEQMFLMSRDLSAIDNGPRIPFMYTAASQVGVFDDPQRQSMPEVLFNMASGGVIGFISATRVGFHDSNILLAQHFHTQMYRSGREHVPVGLALMESKILSHPMVFLDNDIANISRYSLMGDPTQRLARPRLRVEIDIPDRLEALQEARLTGRIVDSDGHHQTDYAGQALVRVFDSAASADLEGLAYVQVGAAIYRGLADVVDGEFSARFRVPKDITYRAARGRASAYVAPRQGDDGEMPSAAFGSRGQIILQGTASDIEMDDEGPAIEIAFKGQTGFRDGDFISSQPTLSARLSDGSGINIAGETGHEIELVVDGDEHIVTDNYTSQDGDYREGILEVALPALEPGEHIVRLKAWDSFNNSNQVEATVRVAEAADAALSDLLFHPNPSPDGTGHFTYILSAPAQTATLRVYALSGRLIDRVEAGAGFGYNQVSWTPPTALAGGTYLYRLEVDLTDGPRIEAEGRLQVVP